MRKLLLILNLVFLPHMKFLGHEGSFLPSSPTDAQSELSDSGFSTPWAFANSGAPEL